MDINQHQKHVLRKLVKDKPLCHPGVSSIAHHDFNHLPPNHLRKVYRKIFRSLKDDRYKEPITNKMGFFFPREHGKSEAVSKVVPTWAALENPDIRILIISETATQARKKLTQCANSIEKWAPKYGRKIKKQTQTELILHRNTNHAEPTIESAGMGKSITGGHYDLIIFDDILSWDNQRTATQREKTAKRFQDYQNLGSKGETTFVVIGTRKHKDDLYGDLISNAFWDTTVEKAISDWSIVENREYNVRVYNEIDSSYRTLGGDEIHKINTEVETVAKVVPERDVDVLWPERWPLDKLLQSMLSSQLGEDESSLVWQRENQNDPSVMHGKILDNGMLEYVDELPKDHSQYSWYAGLDPAVIEDPEEAILKDSDYWGLAIIAHDRIEKQSYLYNIHRRRGMSLTEGVSWVNKHIKKHSIARVLAEDQQAQRWFVQTAKDKGLRVERTSSSGSKEQRIISMASQFETGKVIIVSGEGEANKWQSFEAEWADFPSGDHDDRLDATEIALRNTGGTTTSKSKHDLGEVFG